MFRESEGMLWKCTKNILPRALYTLCPFVGKYGNFSFDVGGKEALFPEYLQLYNIIYKVINQNMGEYVSLSKR